MQKRLVIEAASVDFNQFVAVRIADKTNVFAFSNLV